jgi:hypothetical protein
VEPFAKATVRGHWLAKWHVRECASALPKNMNSKLIAA